MPSHEFARRGPKSRVACGIIPRVIRFGFDDPCAVDPPLEQATKQLLCANLRALPEKVPANHNPLG